MLRESAGRRQAAAHTITERLASEQGTLAPKGRRQIALVYPSPYAVGMASLGFQNVYRLLNHLPDTQAQRAFLPENGERLLTYEGQRPVGDFPVVALSVAYELELPGFFECLTAAGIPCLRSQRDDTSPLVVCGGPLTFSNPVPLAPFADVIVLGEAEDVLEPLVDAAFSAGSRRDVLRALSEIPGVYVPELHRDTLPALAKASDAKLPACSAIVTPNSALPDMFLIEPERGCSRGCTFCVMRRTTNGGMRLVPAARVLSLIPEHARRVGLVGAAVTDHPELEALVEQIVGGGRQIGISSLRADRLTPKLMGLLRDGGYRTLTVASDGASERLRADMEKKIRSRHLVRAAELAGQFQMAILKVYMMVGVPTETYEDLDELAALTLEQVAAAGRTRVALGVAPFVAKRNTPLDGLPFVGIAEADRRMDYLRKRLSGRAQVRPVSARWAFVEHALAQGDARHGVAAYEAWRAGGSFGAFRRAFLELAATPWEQAA